MTEKVRRASAGCRRRSSPGISAGRGDGFTDSLLLRVCRRGDAESLGACHRAQHDDGLAVLIFRRGLHLISRELNRDAVLAIDGREMKSIPVDCYFSAADAKKAPEIDDRRAHVSRSIDDHIN